MRNISVFEVDVGRNFSFAGQECSVQAALSTTLGIMMAGVMFILGCSVKVKNVWLHMQRPWAILVGLLCQIGLMPLIAYLLAWGFSITSMQAVAVIIVGCCPGGTFSNFITYWLDGDMDLSITMTSVSSLLGLGTMPLCLYIYSQSWIQTESIQIPYLNIGLVCITMILPVVFGILVNYKWPNVARIILRIGSVVGGLVMLVVCIALFVLCNELWSTDTVLLTIGGIFPTLGYLAGFIFAVVFRQPWNRCRTIAMETGAQNMQLCGTMLNLFFPSSDVVTLPIIYCCFQILIGFLLVIVFQTYKILSNKNMVTSSVRPCEENHMLPHCE